MKTIEITEEQYEQYQAMLKAAKTPTTEAVKEKWYPPMQEYYFSLTGAVGSGPASLHAKTGMSRSTKELCKIASDRTIRTNRISAWLDSEGSGEQAYSDKINHHFVYEDCSGEWQPYSCDEHSISEVYMLKEDATNLCKALNNSEIEL